ncbi:MAG: hypothetical protein DRJ63_06470 [Thermoprotei archaeon]|nr:MAG: hypothetical protein DRJ63_06470 [Thermoprotei archaeon]
MATEQTTYVSLKTSVTEVALRGHSLEVNSNESIVRGVRVLKDGVYGIASSNTEDFRALKEKALKAAAIGRTASRRIEGLAEAKLAKGSFEACYEVSEEEAVDYVLSLADVLRDSLHPIEAVPEIVLATYTTERSIITSDGADAFEKRTSVELIASATYSSKSASLIVGFTGGLKHLPEPSLLARKISSRLVALLKARPLEFFKRGLRYSVVLSSECAGALFHEVVGHLLEADIIVERKLSIRPGIKLFKSDITVLDDPLIAEGYASYFFDDEGVLAFRKSLVENGRIVSLLHTRWTAYIMGATPNASARGLFIQPKTMQSNLMVKPGDWKTTELIEETREGFYVEGLIKAELKDGIVTIIPEAFYYIRKGEIKYTVNATELRLSLKTLAREYVDIGRALSMRISSEKGFPIAEIAPPIRLKAVVV